MTSFLLMLAAFFVSPWIVGYTMAMTDTGEVGGVIILTAWIWTALYWGTVVHAKQIQGLFEDKNGTKN